MMFQSPSLRGSGRFGRGRPRPRPPKADVSIPFIAGQWSLHGSPFSITSTSPGFNPLHCGAVVASSSCGSTASRPRCVSIPFIAGQWSLHFSVFRWVSFEDRVSIPFIAGQWSLLVAGTLPDFVGRVFQSPSLRGSGRFAHRRPPRPLWGRGFNPLHCGAVVASPSKGGGRSVCISFQSPSLRGSGRFEALLKHLRHVVEFQSPSLRGSGRFVFGVKGLTPKPLSFNPLHCGAVVASSQLRSCSD